MLEALDASRAGVAMILRAPAVLVLALAAALAAFTYLHLERTGRRGWVLLACRAVAWAPSASCSSTSAAPWPAPFRARWCCSTLR